MTNPYDFSNLSLNLGFKHPGRIDNTSTRHEFDVLSFSYSAVGTYSRGRLEFTGVGADVSDNGIELKFKALGAKYDHFIAPDVAISPFVGGSVDLNNVQAGLRGGVGNENYSLYVEGVVEGSLRDVSFLEAGIYNNGIGQHPGYWSDTGYISSPISTTSYSDPTVGSGLAVQSLGSGRVPGYSGRFDDGRGLRAGDELNALSSIAELPASRGGNDNPAEEHFSYDSYEPETVEQMRAQQTVDRATEPATVLSERVQSRREQDALDRVNDPRGHNQIPEIDFPILRAGLAPYLLPYDYDAALTVQFLPSASHGVSLQGLDRGGPGRSDLPNGRTDAPHINQNPNARDINGNPISIGARVESDGSVHDGDYSTHSGGDTSPSNQEEFSEGAPIILNLDNTNVTITEHSTSTHFVDATGDGLLNRTAWAATGNGVLFIDDDGDGTLSEQREYIFTEWDPTATSDMEALASVFDSNGDGVLDASDDRFSEFRLLVTLADGSTEVRTLAEEGISSIDLTADATHLELPDGSIITGQTTFTRTNGTTGTVADVTLVADGQSYRVEQNESTAANGTRTEVSTGYDASGAIAFEITSVTTFDGSQITNTYDDNGDGVIDRIQTINTVTNANGSETETRTNNTGSQAPTAILENQTVTTTSYNGAVVTIERDSTGGGWFDQIEVRTTLANDSRTVVTTDVSDDGTTIRSITETISVDGLTRVEAIDNDGDGTADLTVSHVIVINANGSRSETITTTNRDGSVRSSVIETVSANGKTKTISRDLDGDGDADAVEHPAITLDAFGNSTSIIDIRNGDGTLRSSETHTQTDNALTQTIARDEDGDEVVDVTVIDATVVNADGSRVNTVTATNADGSIRGYERTTLGADQVSSESYIDQNQNGIFEATDLVRSVSVNATTDERTASNWSRNPDGTYSFQSTTVTSEDGLSATTTVDADGDGDTDTVVSDVTAVSGAGVATRTATTANQNGTTRDISTYTTSADGLTVTTDIDRDGDGTRDAMMTDVRVLGGDGSTTRTVSEYAGNGVTLLSRTVTVQSSDRRTVTASEDFDGNGQADIVTTSVEAADGAQVVTRTSYSPDGSSIGSSVTAISANGLVTTTQIDENGDTLNEAVTTQTIDLLANGGQETTTTQENGDGSLRSQNISTISDDGLVSTTQTDANGDGQFERVTTSSTALQSNGSRLIDAELRSSDNTLLSHTQTTISDDGLLITVQSDIDGDGDFDRETITQSSLANDGGRSELTTHNNDDGSLRSRTLSEVSDDGRDRDTRFDLDGDGTYEIRSSVDVLGDGSLREISAQVSSSGELQSRQNTLTHADGLWSRTLHDRDGDRDYELRHVTSIILGANGSQSTTTTLKSLNGTVLSTSSSSASDDGFTRISSEDLDGNGVAEWTNTSTNTLSAGGVETLNSQTVAENGSVIAETTVTTSANGRSVVEQVDLNGNGVDDRVTTSIVGDDGARTATTTYHSSGGVTEASIVTETSSDGLTQTRSIDRNGDGEFDLVTTDQSATSQDGLVTRSVSHRNEHFVQLGSEQYVTSLNGTFSSVLLDLDGDELFELQSETTVTYADNGDVLRSLITRGHVAELLSNIQTVTSGNGLISEITADYSGDGSVDRTSVTTRFAEGGWTEAVALYGGGYALQQSSVTTMSADERTLTASYDIDGDGFLDRTMVTHVDFDRLTQTTYQDLSLDGTVDAQTVHSVSANGMEATSTFDFDGDGTMELTRSRVTGFDVNGNEIATTSDVYGSTGANYVEVQTTAANGLSASTTYDVDGDGTIDGTSTSSTNLNDDGSRNTVTETHYADGDLRSASEVSVSADQRHVVETHDYDGNGINDKISELTIGADGARILTETSYGEGGAIVQRFVTTTSSDGLLTTINRGGAIQTITRSAVDNGSYVWENGITASTTASNQTVTHEIDGLGIETWTSASTTLVNGAPATTTHQVRLDQAAKLRILEDAARIYDSVLDRDMDSTETELLVAFVNDGELDQNALIDQMLEAGGSSSGLGGYLLTQGEFAARYGVLTDAEFITQVYLNTFGRAPGLDELNEHLNSPLTGTAFQTDLIIQLAQSSEHLVVGNGHIATNNFDVIMNPAVFERSLDRAYVESIIKDIVDVVYDRDPTAQELEHLTERLLEDVDNPEDIAAALLGVTGDLQGVYTSSLYGLSGAALVEQAFVNAFNRQPSAAEQQIWEQNLATGQLTAAQFVASLALSFEHDVVGNIHMSDVAPSVQTVNGTAGNNTLNGGTTQDNLLGLAGNDTLNGGAGADRLDGGTGNDTLNGGTGSDVYVWSRGDGSDTINDTSASLTETDRLVLTDVASGEVTITRNHGAHTTYIAISGSTEVITIYNQFHYDSNRYGIEAIEFGDGVIWSLSNLLDNIHVLGTWQANTLHGTDYGDNINGLAGNDSITGFGGDDTIEGGQGNDTLNGADGNDIYVWVRGHGNDTIHDTGAEGGSTDRLQLGGLVSPSDVSLHRAHGSYNLEITIQNAGGSETITVVNQFYSATSGVGIEVIEFGDGTVWTLEDILDQTSVQGTSANNTLSGNDDSDNIYGLAGNDVLNGNGGDDLIVGGLGSDVLYGAAGNDTFLWSKGDGNDTIAHTTGADSETDIDRLILTDVTSNDVLLTRAHGSHHMVIRILSTNETITVNYQHYGATNAQGHGLEVIEFADGVIWSRDDIFGNTVVQGTAAANTLHGINDDDNLHGLGGNDTLRGYDGDDRLVGGTGVDWMDGGNGHDTYYWARGDGNDTIYDTSTSTSDVDVLRLTDVTSVQADLTQVGNNLIITSTVTGEAITVTNRFYSATSGYGIEFIAFSGGVVTEILDSPVAETITTGTAAANSFSGWGFMDTFYGLDGNDTIYAGGGEDHLVGGDGNDFLDGQAGNDTYVWAKGDDNDTISESGISSTETDRLVLTDVSSDDVSLSRTHGYQHMVITVLSTGETITVNSQYSGPTNGYGLEAIEFADGVIWTLDDIFANTTVEGTSGNNTLYGSEDRDNIFGHGGNDTLRGYGGDDQLTGGTGADWMDGINGNDTYVWSKGDGNDTISESGISSTETDRLVLTDVSSDDVSLSRTHGYQHMVITVLSTGETITVNSQYSGPTNGYGLEAIEFADGVIWTLDDIFANTTVEGTSANNTLYGAEDRDNIYGFAGNDTLIGFGGNDTIVGGAGVDNLQGRAGNDTYIWSSGDGNDSLYDVDASLIDIDRLVFTDVTSADVALSRAHGSYNMIITILSTGEAITVVNQHYSSNNDRGHGLEVIEFSDGVIWTLDDIYANTVVEGTNGNNTLHGSHNDDNIHGLDGNDSLLGQGGDDVLVGGVGADTLNGSAGVDIASYRDANQGVTVDLRVATAQAGNSGGEEVGDVLSNIEGLEGSAYDDVLTGDAESNLIYGLAGDDRVYSNGGTNTIELGSGDDYVRAGDGAEILDGGSGTDYISYYDSDGGITANLAQNTISGSWAVNDSINSFESISGSNIGDDEITGTSGANVIRTYGGDDRVYAGSGSDVVELGSGDDYVRVGGGVESFDGGSGTDYISYYDSSNGITIDLAADTVSGSWAVNDTINDFESASGSGTGNDNMYGTSGANTLKGFGGDDKLYGRSGDDKLYGGSGKDRFDGGNGTDRIWGGSGEDVFHLDFGEGHDIIEDFENNVDEIQLDNFSFAPGDDAFDFATQVGDDVIFDFGSGDGLTVLDTTIGQLANDLVQV